MIRKLFVISLLWAVLILIMSGLPGNSLPQSSLWSIPQFDKIVHMCLYFPLGFFLTAEFRVNHVNYLKKWSIPITLFIVALYGGLIEIGQDYLFYQRSADWFDFFSDIVGGALGIAFFYLLGNKLLLFAHSLSKSLFGKNKR